MKKENPGGFSFFIGAEFVQGRSEKVGVAREWRVRSEEWRERQVKRICTEIFAGAGRSHQANELCGTVVSRLRRVADMCSNRKSGIA